MKNKLFSVILLLVIVLVACTRVPKSTEPIPMPTESLPTSADTPQPGPTLAPQPENIVEPGGVEVALTLITIPDQETIALVNGEEISTAAYQEDLERALYSVTTQYMVDWNDPENHSLLPSFQEQVLDQVIYRTLLHQLTSQEGITADPEEVEVRIVALQDQVQQDETIADWASFLAQNSLTEKVIRSLIADEIVVEVLVEQHGGSSSVEQVYASHILVETEETGQEVLDKLDQGEDLGDLAAEYSIDPGSKDQGGDLGWFPRGMMIPEFEEVAFSLEPGETSGLVQTDFGYHIIQVHEKEERDMDPNILAQAQQQQFQVWLETQQAEASIERLYTFEAPE